MKMGTKRQVEDKTKTARRASNVLGINFLIHYKEKAHKCELYR